MRPLIVNDTEDVIDEPFLQKWLDQLSHILIQRQLMTEDKKKLELSLVFLKEVEAKRLNWHHRNKDYATDILSFESEDPESFGELVFCLQVLKKQAKDHKLSFEHELGYLILHGILHLLGFDHEAPGSNGEKMLQLQDEIFQQMLTPPSKAKKNQTGSQTKATSASVKSKEKKTVQKNADKPVVKPVIKSKGKDKPKEKTKEKTKAQAPVKAAAQKKAKAKPKAKSKK